MGVFWQLLTTPWLIPVWPMLLGLILGIVGVRMTGELWERRTTLGTGTVVVAIHGLVLIPLTLAVWLYLGLGWRRPVEVWLFSAAVIVVPAALYGAMQFVLPRVAAIAFTTAKEALAQPLFWVTLAIGLCALVAFPFIPYNTFGEDVKMLKDSGLTLIMVLSIILALWTASVSISDEIEGRTALTVLSKPVSRRDFIVGKFIGICSAVGVMFVLLGTAFLISVSYKVVYDAGELGATDPHWTLCLDEMRQVAPALVLAFLETCVLASISVAISTRLPMLPNLLICSTIYVVGHLIPLLVNSNVGDNEIVRFVARFFASVLPMLDHFNIQAAISTGQSVPWGYLLVALLYAVLYSSFAILGALILFEDRDLA